METKRNHMGEASGCFENLTPLLKNEYNRNKAVGNYNTVEKGNKKKKISNTNDVEDLSVKKSFNEKGLDLVINVELRKRKSNYLDAYFTDLDLHGRKAYHESLSKREQLSNKSKFSDLNLLFTEDLSSYSINGKHDFYLNNEKSEKLLRKVPFNRLLSLNENNKQKYNHKYYQENKDVENFFYKPNEQLFQYWSPLRYEDCPMKPQKKKKLMNEFMKSKSDQCNRNDPKINQVVKKESLSRSRLSIEYRNNETRLKTNKLKVLPLALTKCNKQFLSTTDVVPVPLTDNSNYVAELCEFSTKKGNLDNMDAVCSYPDVNSKWKRFQCEERRKIYSAVKFPESPCMIKMKTSSTFSIHKSYPAPGESSFTRPDMSFESKCFKENIYKFDQCNDHRHRVVIEQNSFITSTISSTDETHEKLNRYTDICYIKKKYNREFKPKNELDNSEFMDFINANKALLDFDLDVNMLNRPLSNAVIETKHAKSLKAVNEKLVTTIRESRLKQPKAKIENSKVETTNTDNGATTKKTLEVIFPVKSMRALMDNGNGNTSMQNKACDKNIADKSSVKSVIEVKITKETVLQSTDIIEQRQPKESLCDDNCNIAKDDKYIKLFKNTLITRREENNSNCNDTDNENANDDLNMILQNDKFKNVVLNIVEQYLKENYLTGNNFKVIVVPKDEFMRKNLNPIEALKDFLTDNVSHSDFDMMTDVDFRNSFPDLSTFNPRDFKGYFNVNQKGCQYGPGIRSNRSSRRKSLPYDRRKPNAVMTAKPREYRVSELDDFHVNEVLVKKLNKNMSMPVVKIKSLENNINPCKAKMSKKTNRNCPNEHENKRDRKSIKDTRTHDKKSNNKPHSQNSTSRNIVSDSSGKMQKAKKKHCKRENICEFITEFNEFKQIFNEVDVKQNALLHVLNYDPCGFLFKIKNGQLVATKRKR